MLSFRTRLTLFVLLVVGAIVITVMPSNAFAATHYTTPPSHGRMAATQVDKDHIVSVVINCLDGSDQDSCLNVHYMAYLELVYLWTARNKSVAEYGCGYGPAGSNHFIDQENPPPHTRWTYSKDGTIGYEYPPKPGLLTGRDLGRIKLDAFCYGMTTDTTMSNEKEGDAIWRAETKGLLDRVRTALA